MNGLGTSALYDARPSVTVAGNEQPELTESLLTVVVSERTDGLYRCEATFGNWGTTAAGELGYVLADRRVLDHGKNLAVTMGSGDKQGVVFDGVVTGLEAHFPSGRAPELVALAEDRFQDLRMTTRSRTFEDVSDADVIDSIARDHGLTAQVDLTGPTHRVLAQVAQSDLAFMRDRARAVGAELWIEDGVVHAATRDRRRAEPVRLVLGSNLREASVTADLAHQRSELTVSGWDVSAKEAVAAKATASVVSGEVGGGESGIAVLERALGPRKEVVADRFAHNEAEAQAAADSALRARARRFCTGHVVAEGDARVRVGGKVELVGLGAGFEGEYYVAEAEHLFDGEHGYRMDLRVERASFGAAA